MKIVAKPIDVLAKFNKEGVPTPIKFKIVGEAEAEVAIKVDRVLTRELEKLAGNKMFIFRCQSAINGVEKVYELKYGLETCKWMLFKI
ncbi:hypothetical protein HNQ80_003382 [Anaerosolibacter carboniphilus]|uniref:Uncharacterized protein n=1 Tax=Anaerosolibacter carboniphilus TaxID=1417629 RepID=A0A841KV52_9FIRM|nr:hypothetical protein [Anaerosolibacter carboniphilus]